MNLAHIIPPPPHSTFQFGATGQPRLPPLFDFGNASAAAFQQAAGANALSMLGPFSPFPAAAISIVDDGIKDSPKVNNLDL